MVSRVHGNDDWWCGGGVLSFYGIVALLVFPLILYSSNFFLSHFGLSAFSFCLFLVILANAGTHRIASVVGRHCYCIVVALVVCCGGVYFPTRHPALVDKWIPVCTGMTTGGRGGVLSVYERVALLMCLVSSLLFQLLPSNFDLLAFFCLLSCHPRERGDPSYSKCSG